MSLGPEQRRRVNVEVAGSDRRGRTYLQYADRFGYLDNEQSLQGKLILDLASGDSPFGVEARKRGATVVMVDPTYSWKPPEHRSNPVAALGQELPFGDGTFDDTLCYWGLPWIHTGRTEVLKEMVRVTKPEGFIKIAPIWTWTKGPEDPEDWHLSRKHNNVKIDRAHLSEDVWIDTLHIKKTHMPQGEWDYLLGALSSELEDA
jgi:SAM-dependent methyltransferase